MCRPLMAEAWDIVARWENQQPVTHRTPVPESMVRAMSAVAWHHGWFSWVGATLISFYGAGRLGEVLRCQRSDLVFPEDLLESPDGPNILEAAKVQESRETTCQSSTHEDH